VSRSLSFAFEKERRVARQTFLDNIRRARNLLVHSRLQDDGPPLARGAIWLTPKAVAGFHPDDFRELGPDGQAEFASAVQEFLGVASEVPPNEEPTADQIARGSALLLKIATILRRYVATSDEMDAVEKALEMIEFPEWVANWDFVLENDWTDEPVVYLKLFTDEKAPRGIPLVRRVQGLTDQVRGALSAFEIKRWPSIKINTVFEYKKV
jgi:hypothetical protein